MNSGFPPTIPFFWRKTEPGSSRVLGNESNSSLRWAAQDEPQWNDEFGKVGELLFRSNYELYFIVILNLCSTLCQIEFFVCFFFAAVLKVICSKWGFFAGKSEHRKFAVDTPKFFFVFFIFFLGDFWISCKTALKQWGSKHRPGKHQDKQNEEWDGSFNFEFLGFSDGFFRHN